ncbi:hypothetical protein [Frankia gtarii]|uniref:hypothetical protein n=1 Tax=Frankia gtarii TaxID=2950102 RepID=UPI0021C0304E|nr:hypothetical protein [Frankia gtarii]
MTEYPAWLPTEKGSRRVFALPAGGRVLAEVLGDGLTLTHLGGDGTEPAADSFLLPEGAAAQVPELALELGRLGRVGRFRNPSVWEAMATAVLRQVIRAAQSKTLYRALCVAQGERVALPDGDVYFLFPAPEQILNMSDVQFDDLGLAFKKTPLRAVAAAILDHGSKWNELPAAVLVDELQQVHRIGPWTAGAAVADFTGDWSLYPYSDLAVRTWAGRAAPSHHWYPKEPKFATQWRHLAADSLSPLTLLTLAWGSHHGDIG